MQGGFQIIGDSGVPSTFTETERNCILESFKDNEIPIHYAFRTDSRINKVTRRDDICVLSPHYITLYSKDKKKRPIRHSRFHISKIIMMWYSESPPFVVIKTTEEKVTLTGKGCLRFAQLVYRNFQISYQKLKIDEVFDIRADDYSLFPSISLQLSPTQLFQFMYAGYATAKKTGYRHEVVRYMHSLLLSGNNFVNLSELPLEFISNEEGSGFESIFTTLRFTHYCTGLCCKRFPCPAILRALTDSVAKGCPFKFIHFEDCSITNGLKEIASKFEEEPEEADFQFYYLDLSKNNIKDIDNLVPIIQKQESPVLHLGLSECNVSKESLMIILNAMKENTNFHYLKVLKIREAKFDQKTIDAFIQYLNVANSILSLDISGDSSERTKIMKFLADSSKDLQELYLSDFQMHQDCFDALIQFIQKSKSLHTLDISNSHLSLENVKIIFETIQNNDELHKFKIILNGLHLNGKKLVNLLSLLLTAPDNKWKALHLDLNSIEAEDVENIASFLKNLIGFEEISLSNNFNYEDRGIKDSLPKLFEISGLKSIIIRGDLNHQLRNQLLPLIKAIHISNIENFNISDNNVGSESYPFLCSAIKHTKTLKKVRVDGNYPGSLDQIQNLVNAALKNPSIIDMIYPIRDARRLTSGKSNTEEAIQLIERYSTQQMTLLQSVMLNRTKNKIIEPLLPFDIHPDIMSALVDANYEFKRTLRSKYSEMKIHSGASSILNLPLPFQNKEDRPESATCPTEEIHIDGSDVYQSPSMNLLYYEPDTPFSIPLQPATYESAKTSMTRRKTSSRRSTRVSSAEISEETPKPTKQPISKEKPKVYKKKIKYDVDSSSD